MLIIFGIILILVGVGLFYAYKKALDKVYQIKATDTTTAKALTEMCEEIATELGSGSFNEVCELKGVIKETTEPLVSELKKIPCAHYDMTVSREYEETVTTRDSQGNQRTELKKSSQTVAHNNRTVGFILEDATGRIRVNPNGAKMDLETVCDEFKPAEGENLHFGDWFFKVGAAKQGSRTLGYHYVETVLPLGRQVYVLGEARDDEGGLTVKKPSAKDKQFIISMKSEAELVQSASKSANIYKYIAFGAGIVGLLLIIIGIIR
jgi:hypothetical protein